jgi:translation initiation factor 1
MAKRPAADPGPAAPAGFNVLSEALRARGLEVREEAPPPAPAAPAAPSGGTDLSRCARAVVRRERKGHGGKTVTVIEGLALSSRNFEAVAREMRKSFGCGSWEDDGRIVLQGDRAAAAETWLRQRGVARVVRGN